MMRPQLLALAVVAAAAMVHDGAHAARISSNPVTGTGDVIALTRTHPAFGMDAPADSLAFVVSGNGTDSENREASDSTDIQRLEVFFNAKMELNYEALAKYPKGSATTSPWPSSYWPTYEDGINYIWNPADKMPPSEKYARAYGLDPTAFKKLVSQTSGILSQSARTRCTKASDCTSLKDSSTCAIRTGETSGYCIPTWFGICHAWAPAAIEEREPRCAVTKNGVTFQPFDIKALITQMYDGAQLNTVFTGSRFNGPDSPANLDKYGRYVDATRRDLGPGFFHVALHNIMGIRKNSMVVDVDQDAQVWNQPVRSYEVISATPLTPAQAAQTFFDTTTYPFNTGAVSIMFIQLKFQYIVEAGEDGPLVSTGKVDSYTTTVYYEYVLELNAAGDIIGGEWVRDSRKTHPDFLWFPETKPSANAVSDIGIKYKDITELLDASADCKELDAPASATPAPAPSDASAAPVTATPVPSGSGSSATPVTVTPSTTSAVPVTAATPAAAPATPASTPAPALFSSGTVSTVSDAYTAISDWLKSWLSSRGRGN